MPGTWAEAQAAGGLDALAGLQGHLAIEPPPDTDDGAGSASPSPTPSGPLPAGYRLRLAVAAAARDGDQDATAALIREGARQGLDAGQLVAVAERHWPKPRLPVRALSAGRRWTVARLRRLHRPRRPTSVLAEREGRP